MVEKRISPSMSVASGFVGLETESWEFYPHVSFPMNWEARLSTENERRKQRAGDWKGQDKVCPFLWKMRMRSRISGWCQEPCWDWGSELGGGGALLHSGACFGRAQQPGPLATGTAVGQLGSPSVGVSPRDYSRGRLALGAWGIQEKERLKCWGLESKRSLLITL